MGSSEMQGYSSHLQLLSHVCSENVIIATVHLSPEKRLFVFHLRRGVNNICHLSAAKVLCCLQLFTGLQRNDDSSLVANGASQVLRYVSRQMIEIHYDIDGS